MGELIQFIPRSRRVMEDFPVIPFRVPSAPVAPANAHEREIFANAPSEMNPDKGPA